MPSVKFNCYAPYPKQKEILDYILAPSDEKKQVDLCCGRGFGKTTLSIILAVMALSVDENQVGLFLEPSWSLINSVFWESWRRLVPRELYTVNKGEQKIIWKNGSVLYYGPRNVSGSAEASRDKYRGLNLTFVIDDEAAVGCDEQFYTNVLACIRLPSTFKFYFTSSTPKVGDYQRLVTGEKHKLFRGTSKDNPYLPETFVEEMLANMSPDQARRELDGEFTTLQGKVWKNVDLKNPWPKGNIDNEWPAFKPGMPWYLMCDLGSATGSYVVVQPKTNRNAPFKGPFFVAVADYCPRDDASAARAFARLKQEFGTPIGITGGADLDTRATTDGTTVSFFAQQIFGNIPIYPCNESIYTKQVQFNNMEYLVCSAVGERRLTVARDFVSLDPWSHRGVREMFDSDEYEEMSKRSLTHILPKSKSNIVQHTRDAMLMGFSQIHAPMWSKGRIPA